MRALVAASLLAFLPTTHAALSVHVGCSHGAGDAAALIAAVNAANALDGATISLAPHCVYSFTSANNHWYGPNALPAIQSRIVILGHGAVLQATHIGDPTPATVDAFRFFYVSGGMESPAGSLTLRGLTLRGGYAKGGDANYGGGGAGMGGAIFNQGELILDAVTLVANTAKGGNTTSGPPLGGGGGMGQDVQADGSGGGFGGIDLPNAFPRLSAGGDSSSAGGGGGGGFLGSDDGYDSIPGAVVGGNGGGIGALGGVGGYYTGYVSTTPNDGGNGGSAFGALGTNGAGGAFGEGGIGNSSTYPGPGGGGGGGGIGGGGGAGAYAGAGGGGFGGGGGSSFYAGNGGFGGGAGTAGANTMYGGFGGGWGGGDTGPFHGGGGAGMGGAIFNHAGIVTLSNVTMTANGAYGGNEVFDYYTVGAQGSGLGGAIFNLNGRIEISFSTIARNSISTKGIFYANAPADAAIYSLAYGNRIQDGSPSSAALVIANSIVYGTGNADHEVVNHSVDGLGQNTAALSFEGGNVIRSYRNSSVLVGTTDGLLTADPLVGPLSNTGPQGALPTMPIPLDSPAYNAAGSCDLPDGSPLLTDERGVARPQAGICDIGAYESDGDYVFASGFE
jgi:hypothetical protein